MVQISSDAVLALAKLSSINLDDEETSILQSDISSILGYIEKLQSLDTKDVEPTYQLTGLTNVWRDDIVEEGIPKEVLLALSEDTKNGQIKVPKVL
jgi:aspartyl-tRNA(Asn)/glutamyl-tRNA(Gln) amidotransferase subunit C